MSKYRLDDSTGQVYVDKGDIFMYIGTLIPDGQTLEEFIEDYEHYEKLNNTEK